MSHDAPCEEEMGGECGVDLPFIPYDVRDDAGHLFAHVSAVADCGGIPGVEPQYKQCKFIPGGLQEGLGQHVQVHSEACYLPC